MLSRASLLRFCMLWKSLIALEYILCRTLPLRDTVLVNLLASSFSIILSSSSKSRKEQTSVIILHILCYVNHTGISLTIYYQPDRTRFRPKTSKLASYPLTDFLNVLVPNSCWICLTTKIILHFFHFFLRHDHSVLTCSYNKCSPSSSGR